MKGFDIVRQLRARQNAILESLPQKLREEFYNIESAIIQIDKVLKENGEDSSLPPLPTVSHLITALDENVDPKKGTRTPLTQRREALREFLKLHGPSQRAKILSETAIPAGTLSALLLEDEFVRTEDGLWTVREKAGSN